MAKEITRVAKIQIMAGQAKPGAALASIGINMPKFCMEFNDATKDRKGEQVPVIITAYKDKSFTFILKQEPVHAKIMKAANIKKGSGKPNSEFVGEITMSDVEEIAKQKMVDMNTNDLEQAKKQVIGSAKSAGVTIKDLETNSKAGDQ